MKKIVVFTLLLIISTSLAFAERAIGYDTSESVVFNSLGIPAGLEGETGHGVVHLTWNAPDTRHNPADQRLNRSLAGYNVYRDNILINTVIVDDTEYSDYDVVNGETYLYYVKAVYLIDTAEIESWASASIEATPEEAEPPYPALALYPEPEFFSIPVDLTFEWTFSPDGPVPDGYLFNYWLASEQQPEMMDLGNVTSYQVTEPLLFSSEYNWQIIPYIEVGGRRETLAPVQLARNADPKEIITPKLRSSGSRSTRNDDLVYAQDCPVWAFTTEDVTVEEFTLTVDRVGLGMIEIDEEEVTEYPSQFNYVAGSEISLSAIPSLHWAFEKWVINGIDVFEIEIVIEMNENKTVTAYFGQLPPLPAAALYPLDEDLNVPIGFEFSWEADIEGPYPNGYLFKYWIAGETQPEPFDVEEAASYWAEDIEYGTEYNWQVIPYILAGDDSYLFAEDCPVWSFATEEEPFEIFTLIADRNGQGLLFLDGAEFEIYPSEFQFEEGMTAGLSATPDQFWSFDRWEIGQEGEVDEVFYSPELDLTITADVFAIAYFKPLPLQPALAVNPPDNAVNIPINPVFAWTPSAESSSPDGYLLNYWTSGDSNTDFIDVSDNITYQASVLQYETDYNWQIIPYVYDPEDESMIEAEDCPVWLFRTQDSTSLVVDFEGADENKQAYASNNIFLSGMEWNLDNALIQGDARDMKFGQRSARLRHQDDLAATMTMLQDKSNGIGTLSFYYARANFTGDRLTVAPVFIIEYSVDQGENWTQTGDNIDLEGVDDLTLYSQAVNISGDIRIRFRSISGSNGRRFNIDNILMTDFDETGFLTPPVNLAAAAGNEMISLCWDAPESRYGNTTSRALLGYNVYRDGVMINPETVLETEYEDMAVVNDVSYEYYVTALYEEGESEPSNAVTAIPNALGIVWQEDFEPDPGDWTLESNWSFISGYLRFYWNPVQTDYSFSATSPVINLPANTGYLHLNQWINYYSFVNEAFEIAVLTDRTAHVLWTHNSGENWGNFGGELLTLSLIPFRNQTIRLRFRSWGDSTNNISTWDIYNLVIDSNFDDDLQALSISGPTEINIETPVEYVVEVRNNGINPQDNYTVKLMKEGDIELAATPGTAIEAGEIQEFIFSWTPNEPETTYLYGEVVLTGDEETDNNITEPLAVNIYPEEVTAVIIGTGTLRNNHLPLNFYFRSSISQTIYMDEEIPAGGLITQITYYTDFLDNLLDMPVMIWMGLTEQDNLSDGWIPASEQTLVYDGTADFLQGQHEMTLELEVPFHYSSGNILVTTHRPRDSQYYGYNNFFFNTLTEEYPNRSRYSQSDTVTYDPDNLTGGSLTNRVPNTKLHFLTAGTGSLEGYVFNGYSEEPLEGALILIEELAWTQTTDEEGYFLFNYVPEGEYSLIAAKDGYLEAHAEVLVPENEVTQVDFGMIPVPDPPQNLTATAGNNYIWLDWEEPGAVRIRENSLSTRPGNHSERNERLELLGYNVYRDGVMINPETVLETEYEDLDVINGIIYEYYVTAVYDDGESGPSNIVEGIPFLPDPPLPALALYPDPEDFSVPVDLTFEWTSYPDGPVPDGYLFNYWLTSEQQPEMMDLGNITSYQVSENLLYGTEYFWQVIPYIDLSSRRELLSPLKIELNETPQRQVTALQSRNPFRNNDYLYAEDCPNWSFMTEEAVLYPPLNLSATAGNSIVWLEWEEPQERIELLGYNIYRDEILINPALLIDAEYEDTDVVNGITYYYFITAVYEEGESGQSNTVAATPHFPSPEGLYALPGNGIVKLFWEAPVTRNENHLNTLTERRGPGNSSGIEANSKPYKKNERENRTFVGYNVYRNGAVITALILETEYEDTDVVNGMTYYYYVTAVYGDGESQPSNSATAVPYFYDPPNYSFTIYPLSLGSSWYDYFPGSYQSSLLQLQPAPAGDWDGGGIYLAYHKSPSPSSLRRAYYSYIANNNIVASGLIDPANNHSEGFPGIDLDPQTGEPIVSWHTSIPDNSGQYHCPISIDQFNLTGIPGLWTEPYSVISNPTTVDGEPGQEFLWPQIQIGHSPTEGMKRAYIFTRNITNNLDGYPCENLMIAYADYAEPSDLADQVLTEWQYTTIPQLDNWRNQNIRAFYSHTVCENTGRIAVVGHTVKLDNDIIGYHPNNYFFVLENNNYGEGDWTLFTGESTIPVTNPNGYYKDAFNVPYQDLRYIPQTNRHNTATDDHGNYHFVSSFYLSNESGGFYPSLTTTKHVKFDRDSEQFLITDLYPRNTDGSLYLPWDTPPQFDNNDWLVVQESWPLYWWNSDTVFQENYYRIILDGPRMVALFQESTKARKHHMGQEGYSQWANVPETHLMISDDYGATWSDAIVLNSLNTPQLNGMIPAYWYMADDMQHLHDNWFRIHLSFYSQNDYGSYIQGNGPNTGGELYYTSIDLEFDTTPDITLYPPQNLTAAAFSNSIMLEWNEPSYYEGELLGYNIYREGAAINPELVLDTEYEDTDVVNGVVYSYYVTALYDEGESEPSNIVEATPMLPVPPLPALALNPEPEDFAVPVDLSFEWVLSQEGPVPDGYLFNYWPAIDEQPEMLDLGNATSYQVAENLLYGTEYSWQVIPYIDLNGRREFLSPLRLQASEARKRKVITPETRNPVQRNARENDHLYAEDCPVWSFTTEEATVEEFTLTVDRIGQGTIEIDEEEVTEYPVQINYLAGSELSLLATPFLDWGFEKWIINGVDHTGELIIIEMNENKTVTAYFNQLPPQPATTLYPLDEETDVPVDFEFYWEANIEGPYPDGYLFSYWITGETQPEPFDVEEFEIYWAEDIEYGTEYNWQVIPYIFADDESVIYAEDCPVWSFTTEVPDLNPPQNLIAAAGNNIVWLEWEEPEVRIELLGYNVYRDEVMINPETVLETEYEDSDVINGEIYEYYVTALYEEGESEPTETVPIYLELTTEISISPEYLETELFTGYSTTDYLTIYNEGENDLIVEISLAPEPVRSRNPLLIPGESREIRSISDFLHPTRSFSPNYSLNNQPRTSGNSVLYITTFSSDQDSDFRTVIEELPNVSVFETLDARSQTPNVDYLLAYDIVIVASNYGFANQTLMGDNLAHYVDQGGTLCLLEGTFSYSAIGNPAGGWTLDGLITEPQYSPLAFTDYSQSSTYCDNFVAHPITNGVSFIESTLYTFTYPQGNGVSLGLYQTGDHVAAYNPDKPIAAINVFPHNAHWGGDFIQMMSNTIDWLSAGAVPWLALDQYDLSIEPGSSEIIEVTYNAAGLAPDVYNASINIESNDPEEPFVSVPVTMTVLEDPYTPPVNLTATIGDGTVDLYWGDPGTRSGNNSFSSLTEGSSVNRMLFLSENSRDFAGREVTFLGYNVYRDGVRLNIDLIPGTEYSDSGLINGVTYEYYVTAVYEEGESVPSNTIQATPYIVDIVSVTPVFGNGTEENPYQIAELLNLYWIAEDPARWAYHYIQTADIDASETAGWFAGNGWKPIGMMITEYHENNLPFTGSYDGQNYMIAALYSNRTSTLGVGLFGHTAGATIRNLAVTNVDLTGYAGIGGLVGAAFYETHITNTYTTGTANGFGAVGGIAGANWHDSIIERSRSSVNVTNSLSDGSRFNIGGLAGNNGYSASIIDCYSTGNVSGYSSNTGGLVGFNRDGGVITNSFSTGLVIGHQNSGGLVGNSEASFVNNSFWDIETSNQIESAGGEGQSTNAMKTETTYTAAGWDFLTVWGMDGYTNEGYPYLQWEMLDEDILLPPVNLVAIPANEIVHLFWNAPGMRSNDDYTFRAGDPDSENSRRLETERRITLSHDRNLIGYNIYRDGIQLNTLIVTETMFTDTDVENETTYQYFVTALYDEGESEPSNLVSATPYLSVVIPVVPAIGSGTSDNPYQIESLDNLLWITEDFERWDYHYIQTADIDASSTIDWFEGKGWKPIGNSAIKFTGSYDGMHHSIDWLFINRNMTDYNGLFGYTNGADIRNLGLTNINYTGNRFTGAFVGKADNSTITDCYSTGNLTGTGIWDAGGIVGWSYNTQINSSYSLSNITGQSYVGGLVGYFTGGSLVENSYAMGSVTGNSLVGGLIGYNSSSLVSSSFSTGLVTGISGVGGLIGAPAGANAQNSFWDINTSGRNTSAGGEGKTTAEMKTASTFVNAGWDMMTTWIIDGVNNTGYPYLRWQMIDGTIVPPGEITELNWTAANSPYYITYPIIVEADELLTIENGVEVIFTNIASITVYGGIEADGVIFNSTSPMTTWNGIWLTGSVLNVSFNNCTLINAVQALVFNNAAGSVTNSLITKNEDLTIDEETAVILQNDSNPDFENLEIENYAKGIVIINDLMRRTSTPTLTNIRIRNTTSPVRTQTVGIEIQGDVGLTLEDAEIDDFEIGIHYTGGSTSPDRTTPTLTNIRIRNTTSPVRTNAKGIVLTDVPEIEITDGEIEDYPIGIFAETTADQTRSISTPTLTNIRIRNSTSPVRTETIGIELSGAVALILADAEIDDYDTGFQYNGDGTFFDRSTPTLTNIRIRNTTSPVRNGLPGIILRDVSQIAITEGEIEDYTTGMLIETTGDQARSISTPTLTNIRIRNTTSPVRTEATGIEINGAVAINLDDAEIDDYDTGILYNGDGTVFDRSTPTLTNIRIRNTTSPVRTGLPGIILRDVSQIAITEGEIDDYSTGMLIETTGDQTRSISTPTLTNIRIRNTTSPVRTEATGIEINGAVAINIDDAEIDDYDTGIIYTGDGTVFDRSTPTLTNIRIRNTTSPVRTGLPGIILRDVSQIAITEGEIDDYPVGMLIETTGEPTRSISTPTLTNIRIRNTTSPVRTETRGIEVNGAVALNIDDAEIDEYDVGIQYTGDGTVFDRSTPTLTNIRIRNTTSPVRNASYGMFFQDVSSYTVANVDSLYGYSTGIHLSTSADNDRSRSTPTLTNIRIRNTTSPVRNNDFGIVVDGNVSAVMDSVYIDDFHTGIKYSGRLNGNPDRATPTLTNIRIRNTTSPVRSGSVGIALDGTVSLNLEDAEIDDYDTGIEYLGDGTVFDRSTPTLTNIRIRNTTSPVRTEAVGLVLKDLHQIEVNGGEIEDYSTGILIDTTDDTNRSLSTPTLTNIRIRNTTSPVRNGSMGIGVSGTVALILDDAEIDDFDTGIEYIGDGTVFDRSTPTLTNIRIRNTTSPVRTEAVGLLLRDLSQIELNDGEIEDYSTGILIETTADIHRSLSTPTLTNIRIRNTTSPVRNGSKGIGVSGTVALILADAEIDDYDTGIEYIGDGTVFDRSTPTLTNIRIRNTTSPVRTEAVGLLLRDLSQIELNDGEIEDYSTGILIETTDNTTRSLSTPTLTNIRIRNTTSPVRTGSKGIGISGTVALILADAEIEDFDTGIEYIGDGTVFDRSTPTLTNIRIRNTTSPVRTEAVGLLLRDLSQIELNDGEIEDYSTGILIETTDNSTRSLSTPTLTNIRIRNTTSPVRNGSKGIGISGTVALILADAEIDDYNTGIEYIGNGTIFDRSTPTLTNIRIRNTTSPVRTETVGLLLQDLHQIDFSGGEIDDYATGLLISTTDTQNRLRTMSTPTLTNIRVRNTTSPVRTGDDTGIRITGNVSAVMDSLDIENYHTGLMYIGDEDDVRSRATPTLTNIRIRNTTSPVRTDPVGMHLENISLQGFERNAVYVAGDPGNRNAVPGQALRFESVQADTLKNTTIWGYETGLYARESAGLNFAYNIIWVDGEPLENPIDSDEPVNVSQSVISYAGDGNGRNTYPGDDNLNVDPKFVDPRKGDFFLRYRTPLKYLEYVVGSNDFDFGYLEQRHDQIYGATARTHELHPGWNLLAIPFITNEDGIPATPVDIFADYLDPFFVNPYYTSIVQMNTIPYTAFNDEGIYSLNYTGTYNVPSRIFTMMGYWVRNYGGYTTLTVEQGFIDEEQYIIDVPGQPNTTHGWYLLANPYYESLSWADGSIDVEGNVHRFAYVYAYNEEHNAYQYLPVDEISNREINRWEGFFIKSNDPDGKVILNFPGDLGRERDVSGNRELPVTRNDTGRASGGLDIPAEEWLITLGAQHQDKGDFLVVSANSKADDTLDPYDVPKLPQAPFIVTGSLMFGIDNTGWDNSPGYYARDTASLDNSFWEWDIMLDATDIFNEPVDDYFLTVFCEEMVDVPDGYRFTLTNLLTGEAIDPAAENMIIDLSSYINPATESNTRNGDRRSRPESILIPLHLHVATVSTGSEDDSPVQTPIMSLRNYPNPFNPETRISFAITEDSNVRIEIFNVKGQLVKTLIDEYLKAGPHSVVWNGSDNNNTRAATGIYLYRMTAGDKVINRKMIMMK
jgi:hypothetical protein